MGTWKVVLVLTVALALIFTCEARVETLDPGGVKLMKIRPLHERQQLPADVAVAVWPIGIIDAERTHYLNHRTPTPMLLSIGNPKWRGIGKAWLVFDLPVGVDLRATNGHLRWDQKTSESVVRGGKKYTRYRILLRPAVDTIPKRGQGFRVYAQHRPPVLWLYTAEEPGARPGRVYLRLDYEEGGQSQESAESWIEIGVLPELEAKTPRIAKSGLMGRASVSYNDSHPEAPGIIASYIAKMGCNYYYDGPPQSEAPVGLKRWTEGRNIWQMSQGGLHIRGVRVAPRNGFNVLLTEDASGTIPVEEIGYAGADMSRRAGGLCSVFSPWALYGRHPWVVKNVLDPIAEDIARGDYEGFWSNWEPADYAFKEGYSQGTKKAFIKWSKLPADEVEKLWPQELVKKYPKKWQKFRNWEMGQWVKVVAETVRSASLKAGGDGYFIIAAGADCIYEGASPMYCGAWGDFPYVFQTWSYHNIPYFFGRYPVSDNSGSPQIARSARLARQLDELFGTNRQALGSCLYGWDQQPGRKGFYVPEKVGFLQLSTIMAGLEIVSNYGEWPIFDARYAQSLARANTRIARWEEYVLKGKKQRKHVVIPESPYPQAVPLFARPEDQSDFGFNDYMFSFEYEKHGKRLFAVANAWDFGDCFFKLRVHGLDADQKYLLTEPEENRVFASATGETALTAAELEEGITLHAGAMRWGCFLLEPYGAKAAMAMKPITSPEMKAALKRRWDTLSQIMSEQDKIWKAGREEAARGGVVSAVAEDCSQRVALVRPTDAAPNVDGVLDDGCWDAAQLHGSFRTARGRSEVKAETAWRAVLKGKTLYLAVECKQDMTAPSIAATDRDGRVWRDDSVEVILNPVEPKDDTDYFQVVVNPNGVIFDIWRGNKGWNGIKELATKKLADGWSFEVAIPLEKIGIDPDAFPVARCNLVRNVIATKYNPPEMSSWFPSWGAHADFRARGVLIFR